jgi:YidC/Oxa1 family membrane protein insertase
VFKGNIGIALGGLSLAVNLFCLPMYAKAEQLQQLERNIQKKLAGKTAVIKKCFTGDERYFILSMFYRENNYHPVYSLRSSLSLLIQIPFFIAAYSFLINLDSLAGNSFLFLHDLSQPDRLFIVSGFSVNILPFIMTLINLAASIIYGGNLTTREKVQLYLTPLVFLLLLYNSPSALVLYWTMNNVFSLFKTLLLKTKNPSKVLYAFGCICAALFAVYVLFIRYNAPDRALRNKAISIAIFAAFAMFPVILKIMRYSIKKTGIIFTTNNYTIRIFIISVISIWLLVGFFVPANIVSSDPYQFALVKNIESPLKLLFFPIIQGAGLLFFWPLLLFFLSSRKSRTVVSLITAAVSFSFFTNYFIFQPNYGIISQTLTFSLISGQYLSNGISYQIINGLCFLFLLAVVFFFSGLKKVHFTYIFLIILSLGTIAYGFTKIVEIQRELSVTPTSAPASVLLRSVDEMENEITGTDILRVSKTGKNVFVIMLDGAVSSYFPLFIKERPELNESFNGFTYYPNTASFYRRTMFGAPPLFGGYEYTTYNMDDRIDATIYKKQQEALTLLPLLFKDAGFSSYVSDIPNSEFFNMPPEDFYGVYGIKAYNMAGRYTSKYLREVLNINELTSKARIDELLKRNLLMLSLLVTMPYCLRDFLYINGNYWSTADYRLDSVMSSSSLDGYTSLYYFPKITSLNENRGTFHIIVNNLTHDHAYLQYPDYTLEEDITEYGSNFFNTKNSFKAYHVNAAAYMLLSKWFNQLKEYGVWDNTRIIIVSDHGDLSLDNPQFTSFQNNYVIPYNPILLVKDFNQNEPLSTNNDFMTNADTPLLALQDIVQDPINPFTGKMLAPEKSEGIYIFTQGYTNAKWYQGTTCLDNNSLFFHVHDDIFNSKNWTELKYRDFREKN